MKNRKGQDIGYSGIHHRIHKYFGKLRECVYCGSEDRLELGSVSHKALPSVDDYISLCKSCHNKYDRYEAVPWWRRNHPAFVTGGET